MATLLLQTAGFALGTVIGGPIGGLIGRAAGGLAGYAVDQELIARATPARRIEGPRLKELGVQASSEGAPVPRMYGRARLAGQIIWATQFEEEATTTVTKSGGKFGGTRTRTTTYNYYANFAVGLCEGEITRIGRIWADGKLLDTSDLNFRIYTGSEDQLPDPLIEAKEGGGNAPAYRGLAYVVFERLPLEDFGNRLPQLAFELFRVIDDLEARLKAMTIIPGATEFGYDPVPVTQSLGVGQTAPENQHVGQGPTDWTVSIDELAETCPNVSSLSLTVAWFGTDLRCGDCEVRPGVETAEKDSSGRVWEVNGIDRTAAHLVSQVDGRPAFGGTPSDASVIAAIQDLKARGKKVVFHPFLMMDVPSDNGLPDPYGGAEQAAYPWRGRISCDPAPGQPASPDKSAAATTQVESFFGDALPADFTPGQGTVSYEGPQEWSYRRLVLHYAHLCVLAGGVDAFLVGSELRALGQVRDTPSHYPAVDELATLAMDVRSVVGSGTKVSYAADWSEYFGHQPQDGSGDVFFHLDSLWASDDVDFIGIDNYMPLSDWRDGDAHLDALSGVPAIYDLEYLRGNIAGGEGFDWFYASEADRENQQRTSITDGAYSKPWVYRFKDLKSWWGNEHFDRPSGIEDASATDWVPQSKPIWFAETGCPAVDRGANQPNVFYDPKSSESALPHFSNGVRDDLIQRRYIHALTSYWDPSHPDHDPADNPISSVYGEPMVDAERIHIWAWDARPFPQFPFLVSVWSDGPNWERGHWLNGRAGIVPLDRLVAEILGDYGFAQFDADDLYGIVEGYVVDRPMSARQAVEPLSLAYFFDAVESDGLIAFRHRDVPTLDTIAVDDLVARENADLFERTRAQESELPVAAGITYIDSILDYRVAAVESRRLVGTSRRDARAELPIITSQRQAQAIADVWLQDIWVARETADFVLPPSRLALEPGDVVGLGNPGAGPAFRLSEINDALARHSKGRALVRSVFRPGVVPTRSVELVTQPVFGPARVQFMDIPAVSPEQDPARGAVAAFAEPWPGAIVLYRSATGASFDFLQRVELAAIMGETLTTFAPGPSGRWDMANRLQIQLYGGVLDSQSLADVLGGANLAAIRAPSGAWELFQFADATLIAADTYELSRLLRGQFGTELAMAAPVPAGADFVLLDGRVERLVMSSEDIGLPYTFRFGPAGRDIGDAAFRDEVHAFNGNGLKPFSPVHVRARSIGADNELSWIRRTRIGGDSWDQIEVPLGEDTEAYEVDVLNGSAVVRTLSATMPSVLYTEAMQAADFGSPPQSIEVDVYQLSATHGRGTPRRTTLNV